MEKKVLKIKQLYKQKAILFKMALSYLLLGSLLISVFSIVLSSKVSNDLSSEIRNNSEKMIYQSYSTADTLLMSTYQYFYQAFNKNSQIFEALYGKDLDQITVGKINEKLNELLATNPLVKSIYVYNYQDELVFSTLSTSSALSDFYDKGMTRIVEDKKTYASDFFIPRKENFKIYNNAYNDNIISIVYTNDAIGNYTQGVLVVNLDQQLLQQLVTKGETGTTTMMIIDKEGTIISDQDGRLINTNIHKEPYIQRILSNGNKEEHFIANVQGEKSLISYIKSDRLGWSFVAVSAYNSLLGKITLLKQFILVITIIFALLGLIAGGLFTKVFYKPINRLLQKARSNPALSASSPLGEYDMIFRSFDSLEHNIRSLQAQLQQHLPQSKKAMLHQLLSGECRSGLETERKLKQVHISLQEGSFQVLVIRLDDYARSINKYGIGDMSLFKYAAANIINEVVQGYLQGEMVEDAEDSLAVIMNGSKTLSIENEAVARLNNEIRSKIESYLKLSVTIGVGMQVERFDQIKYSWNTASLAANSRLVQGTGQVFYYEKVHRAVTEAYDYPLQIERKILDALKAGDLKKLRKAFDEFTECINGYSYDEILVSLNQLMVMTLRMSSELADDQEEWMIELQDAHRNLRKYDTIIQIREWYFELCVRIVQIRDQKSEGRNKANIEKLIKQIEAQYADPNLSVEALAGTMGFSTNYTRKIFKEYIGKSMSAFIGEYRFEKAKELLLRMDLPANRVGEMVGMTNTNYFYVSFKKYTGKTPDHYRKDKLGS